jgi:myo-inositol-1(or 4)-monophosphatase
MDLEQAMRVAVRAAYRGADALRAGGGDGIRIQAKGPRDIVTDRDLAAERAIVAAIRSAYPDHAVVAEEGGALADGADYRWFVDPLDGTINFARGIPVYAVSIALHYRQQPLIGAVLNPVSGELFTAVAGKGARLNGEPVKVSDEADLSRCLLATGFPYRLEPGAEAHLARFGRCLRASLAIRRLGSAALDLCYVAAGRFDGFWEQDLQPWDVAAGMLIVREAGGRVSDYGNGPDPLGKREIIATNGRIHAALAALMEAEAS